MPPRPRNVVVAALHVSKRIAPKRWIPLVPSRSKDQTPPLPKESATIVQRGPLVPNAWIAQSGANALTADRVQIAENDLNGESALTEETVLTVDRVQIAETDPSGVIAPTEATAPSADRAPNAETVLTVQTVQTARNAKTAGTTNSKASSPQRESLK